MWGFLAQDKGIKSWDKGNVIFYQVTNFTVLYLIPSFGKINNSLFNNAGVRGAGAPCSSISVYNSCASQNIAIKINSRLTHTHREQFYHGTLP